MEIQPVAERTLKSLKTNGADKALVTVSKVTIKEFNIEANRQTLLRTTFDQNVHVKALLDQRQAVVAGNQFSDEDVARLSATAVATAKSSPQDPANGFAPPQGQRAFQFGSKEVDESWMQHLLSELLEERKRDFPSIIFDSSNVKYIQSERTLMTSDGTVLSSRHGHYEGFIFFSAKEGKRSSSFNYAGFQIAADDAGKPLSLMQTSGLHELVRQSSEQIHVQKVPGKFEGDVILTPHCLGDFVGAWFEFLSAGQLLKGASFFKDKIGQQVASPLWTISANPIESKFATRRFWNSDGYVTQNETIFDNGVLKSYLLNHYGATKLKDTVSRSGGDYLLVRPGKSKLQEMIGSVKKGVLMCRYSAGRPAENGDISGVAKNSYYIEDGAIKFPLSETMVSGNLAKMLVDIQAVSTETVSNGSSEMPWIKIGNIHIS